MGLPVPPTASVRTPRQQKINFCLQKEYEQLRNPDLLGGATIGEELGEPSLAFH